MTSKTPVVELDELRTAESVLRYRILRSARRTLEISVDERGELEVRAPLGVGLDRIRQRVRRRSVWIVRRLRERELADQSEVPRTYESGETHRYLGRQHRLELQVGSPEIAHLRAGRLVVRVRDPRDKRAVRRVLESWFGHRAHEVFASRLEQALELPSRIGVRPTSLRIQRMHLRWGSCTARGKIVLNRDLVRLPVDLIDYVIVHELCHLAVPSHGAKFERLLDRCMPDWRVREARLRRQVLS